MTGTFEPTDFTAQTRTFASAFQDAIERSGLRYETDFAQVDAPVMLDRALWEQVVLNLLSNALKFTHEGAIHVSTRAADEFAELRVRDTGIGVPPEQLPRLFERFHRVPGQLGRTHEGTGIGLALVRELVALHGGSVHVESTVGEGTTFTVLIPLGTQQSAGDAGVSVGTLVEPGRVTAAFVEEAGGWSRGSGMAPSVSASSAVASLTASDGPVGADNTARARILFVDDNADLRAYVSAVLAPTCDVDLAADGVEALERIAASRPELVLTDVMMPRMDGFALLARLREHVETRDIPVILLSARSGDDALVAGLGAGADDYLAKPFSSRELRARVGTHVALARERAVVERFFALSVDLIAIATLDGRFLRLSHGFCILGYTEAELLGRPFMDFVHPSDVEATAAEMARLAAGGRSDGFENRYMCRDGSYRWLSWTSASLGDRVYAIARDVTEANQAVLELVSAREAAELANRELEAFSYSVAHDLRAPLRSIDGFSQALVEDYGDALGEEGQRHLQFVRESAQEMGQLIDDLLALSRVTRLELRRIQVDLSLLARTALGRLRRTEPGRAVETLVEDGLVADGDPTLLGIAVENLIGNAWKFTARRADAQIAFGRGSDGVYFVRDNGAGFDMAFAHRLFGVFQRLHTADEFDGTGIGLASVRRAVERHGGRVWGEGVVDGGATFHFTLGDDGGGR